MTEIDTLHAVEFFDEVAPDAGIFTWTILDNTLFADTAVAELFGLDGASTIAGLPLEAYIDRVHPADRPALARVIQDTILGEFPQQHGYRVLGADGRYRPVIAFARAFRNREGVPVVYSGMIVPAGDGGVAIH